MYLPVPDDEAKWIFRAGGVLLAALSTFPTAKYLQRTDRVSALRMWNEDYERLWNEGSLDGPVGKQLNRRVDEFINRIGK
jgi:hypothetical protein